MYDGKPQCGGTYVFLGSEHLPTGASIEKIKFNDLGPPGKFFSHCPTSRRASPHFTND